MRAVLLLLAAVLVLPTAGAAVDGVRLGMPTSDPSTALSVRWHELAAPRADMMLTLDGPGGARDVPAGVLTGPSLGTVYEAELFDLEPGSNYTYAVDGRSFGFRTPPASLSPDRPLRIVALGDMGTGAQARATVEAVAELSPDLVLHAGDISYAEGRQPEWDTWFAMTEPVAATIPWMTALGNHETYTANSLQGVTGVPSPAEIAYYQQRFAQPDDRIAYSFDWAGVHFVALDTFSQRQIPEGEAAWLEADLAASTANWTIVFLHEPPYSSNAAHGSSERVQEAFGRIFAAHNVTLVIAGHDHAYERTRPIAGVTYIVTGGAGQGLYTRWEDAPEWSAYRDAKYHVTLFDIWPDRIEGSTVGTGGDAPRDSFTITATGVVDHARAPGVEGSAVPSLAPLALVGAVFLLARLRRR